MRLKTTKGSYEITNVNHENGKLNIEFSKMSCEQLQDIFNDKNSLIRLEVYTDDNDLTAIIPGYVELEQVVLHGDIKTVILVKEACDIEKRITELSEEILSMTKSVEQTAEVTAINASSVEQLTADVDYISMNMEVTLNV